MAGRIEVLPLRWLGQFVVLADVAHELALEVCQRSEHTTCDHIAFNLSEPRLNLIEPGRVGWREAHVNRRLLGQERADLLGLVRREVVGNDTNSLPRGWLATMSLRRDTSSAEVWRAAVLPSTSPVLVLKVAYRDSVLCLKYSKP